MNTKSLLFLISCATLMIASTTVMAQTSIQSANSRVMVTSGNSIASTTRQYTRSVQSQQTIINSSSPTRRQPYVLSVSAKAGTQITGQVIVNGVVVKKINQNKTSINLSPHLSKGRQKIEITGNYKPVSNSVAVELAGPGTKLAQQTGGNGRLKQTLIIDMR